MWNQWKNSRDLQSTCLSSTQLHDAIHWNFVIMRKKTCMIVRCWWLTIAAAGVDITTATAVTLSYLKLRRVARAALNDQSLFFFWWGYLATPQCLQLVSSPVSKHCSLVQSRYCASLPHLLVILWVIFLLVTLHPYFETLSYSYILRVIFTVQCLCSAWCPSIYQAGVLLKWLNRSSWLPLAYPALIRQVFGYLQT